MSRARETRLTAAPPGVPIRRPRAARSTTRGSFGIRSAAGGRAPAFTLSA
jgi:hypothetical protein